MEATCSIDECTEPVVARGWCRKHYARWHTKGDPLTVRRLYRAPLADRLASMLDQPDERGCLNFLGWTSQQGYGSMKVAGRMVKPHRVAFELAHGPIPPGMSVCHRCDNPSCCNPQHLFLGSHADNMADMNAKGRGDTSGLRSATDLGDKLKARAVRLRAESAVAAGHPSDWKHCSRCGDFKSPDEFGPNAARPDGLQTYCRPCLNRYKRERKG